MMIEWRESIDIPDGGHTGQIVKLAQRTEPYNYLDIWVKLDGHDVELKYGCPAILSSNSKLGRLLIDFGETPQKGKQVDPDKVLLNQKVKFMTLKRKNKEGKEYSEIIEGSIKPNKDSKDIFGLNSMNSGNLGVGKL